jgi:hypothetical protein
VDIGQFRDFGMTRTSVVTFFGHFMPQRPWRIEAAKRLRPLFPCTMFPHDTWRTNEINTRMRYGELYARTLNTSQFVPVEGSYYQLFTRKFFETPACRTALVVPRIGALAAFGFVDMKNCIMGEPAELAEKIDHFLADEAAYESLVDSGRALIEERHSHKQRTQIRDWFEAFRARAAATRIVQDGPFGPFRAEPFERPAALPSVGRRPQIDLILLHRGINALKKRKLVPAERDLILCMDLLYARYFAEPRFYLALVRLLQGRPREAIYLMSTIYLDRLEERELTTADPRAAAFIVLAYLCMNEMQKAADVLAIHGHLVRDELFWVREYFENPPPLPPAGAPQNLSLFSYMPMGFDAWKKFVRDAATASGVEIVPKSAAIAKAATPRNWREEEDPPSTATDSLLAITAGRVVMGYRSARHRIYRHWKSFYYNLPEGVKIEALSGGGTWTAETPPTEGPSHKGLLKIRLISEVRGTGPVLVLHAYDEQGNLHTRKRLVRGRKMTMSCAIAQPASVRIGLIFWGSGTFDLKKFKLEFGDEASASEPTTQLGALLQDDVLNAAADGAEIPEPKAPSI